MAKTSAGWPRNLLRTVVLKTNPYAPFRQCNRWPYHLAVKRVVSAFRGYREVKALYLRHGLASAAWIPGLSDIDLTLVVEPGLSAAREFAVVDGLRAEYRSLQRWLPMLGELDILGADDLPVWLGLTSLTPSPRAWTLLHGAAAFDAAADRSPDWRSRAVTEALGFYVFELAPYLSRSDSYLGRLDIERRVRKIMRLLTPVIGESAAGLLKSLAAAVACVDPGARSGSGVFSRTTIPYCGGTIVVCGDGVAEEELAAVTAAGPEARPPVILTGTLFRYFARKYNPYDYAYLLGGGASAVKGLSAPDTADFAAYLLSRLAHALVFTRGPELFPASQQVDPDDLHAEVKRLMGIQLLAEKGWTIQDWLEIEARWTSEYPERAQALQRILRGIRDGAGIRRQEVFAFFRSFAFDAYSSTVRAFSSGSDPR